MPIQSSRTLLCPQFSRGLGPFGTTLFACLFLFVFHSRLIFGLIRAPHIQSQFWIKVLFFFHAPQNGVAFFWLYLQQNAILPLNVYYLFLYHWEYVSIRRSWSGKPSFVYTFSPVLFDQVVFLGNQVNHWRDSISFWKLKIFIVDIFHLI